MTKTLLNLYHTLPCWSKTRRIDTNRGTFADTAHPNSGSMANPNFGKVIADSLGTVLTTAEADDLDGFDTPCEGWFPPLFPFPFPLAGEGETAGIP